MYPSAQICRAQEARQRTVSLNAPLMNVRQIAALAAAAWAKEAASAEHREARAVAKQAQRLELVLPLAAPRLADFELSENPDRGFADS